MTDILQSNPFQTLQLSNVSQKAKEIPNIPKHVIRAKLAYARQRFQDLDIFRKHIEQAKAGIVHQPYTYSKRNIFWYRLIFTAFALLFFGLGYTTMSLTSTIGCGFFASSCNLLKTVLVCGCAFLSFCSILMAFYLSPERDAALLCERKAKAILATIYKRRKIRLGINGFAFFSAKRQQAKALKHVYEEANDRIHDKKEATLQLLHRIATTPALEKEERETLFNQALEELNDKVTAITHDFRHADI